MQVLRWLKSVGEPVAADEPLIEIETDKVTVEVAAPAAGVVAQILRDAQDEVEPGELLGRIGAGAAGSGRRPESTAAPAPTTATAAPARAPQGGQLSPAVRRLLAERGLKPEQVRGSGPAGRIMVEDVLAAAAGTPAVPEAAPQIPAPPAVPDAGVRRIPHTVVRRRIAEHMVDSLLHTAPHVTTVFEADLGAVLADRERQRGAFAQEGVPLTLTAYFVQAVVAGLRAVPEANSRWTDTALELHDAMNIGIATAVEGTGLVVPVLAHAERLDLKETARQLDDLVQRARAGRLTPADVRGGTFTISNHGVSGSLLAAPIIINQPQSAILGIGRLERRAVVVGEGAAERIEVRPRAYVTLTLDHRVMDGHQANRFLQVFVERLTHWA
ncbi:MAG: 2-oxo acid dehydrogenase subunit E2 [Proteobacteria bacterium]|nr:2-oxo acid dehydrogenase subunit E2 [Pseudomonadota bacterium]